MLSVPYYNTSPKWKSVLLGLIEIPESIVRRRSTWYARPPRCNLRFAHRHRILRRTAYNAHHLAEFRFGRTESSRYLNRINPAMNFTHTATSLATYYE